MNPRGHSGFCFVLLFWKTCSDFHQGATEILCRWQLQKCPSRDGFNCKWLERQRVVCPWQLLSPHSPPPVRQWADSASLLLDIKSGGYRTGEMGQWVKASATELEDVSSIPETHMMEGETIRPHVFWPSFLFWLFCLPNPQPSLKKNG